MEELKSLKQLALGFGASQRLRWKKLGGSSVLSLRTAVHVERSKGPEDRVTVAPETVEDLLATEEMPSEAPLEASEGDAQGDAGAEGADAGTVLETVDVHFEGAVIAVEAL